MQHLRLTVLHHADTRLQAFNRQNNNLQNNLTFYYLFIYITESSAYISLKISKQQRAQSTNAAQHQHSMQHAVYYIALACMNHDARCTKLAELFTALHTTQLHNLHK